MSNRSAKPWCYSVLLMRYCEDVAKSFDATAVVTHFRNQSLVFRIRNCCFEFFEMNDCNARIDNMILKRALRLANSNNANQRFQTLLEFTLYLYIN